jgi:hypothetical protein
MLFAAVIITIVQSGCGGDGVAYTRRERQARHRDIIDNDWKQLTDDFDYLLLMEHKTHLSKWQIE